MSHPAPPQDVFASPVRQGFSLIELTLVTVIVGIVAAMAVPRYADALARYRADAAAQRVVANLERAQTLAQSSSRDVTVWFRVHLDILEITDRAGTYDGELEYQTQLGKDPYHADLVSADFGGNHFLVFGGYGQPNSGGTATLAVGGLTRTVTLDPHTGKVSIQ